MQINTIRSLLLTAVAASLVVPTVALAQHDVLHDMNRPEAERERDAGSKPLEVYAFFGIEPGMTVIDLMPGGGYNTYLLSSVVGAGGKVMAGPDRRGRLAERTGWPVANVEIFNDLAALPEGGADAIVTVRNLHDVENGGDWEGAYALYLRALKPGGTLGVVDARTPMEGFDENTHRINQQTIIDHLTAAGFEFVEESDLLANPDDDFGEYEGMGNRVEIDRMVLKFRRPS